MNKFDYSNTYNILSISANFFHRRKYPCIYFTTLFDLNIIVIRILTVPHDLQVHRSIVEHYMVFQLQLSITNLRASCRRSIQSLNSSSSSSSLLSSDCIEPNCCSKRARAGKICFLKLLPGEDAITQLTRSTVDMATRTPSRRCAWVTFSARQEDKFACCCTR